MYKIHFKNHSICLYISVHNYTPCVFSPMCEYHIKDAGIHIVVSPQRKSSAAVSSSLRPRRQQDCQLLLPLGVRHVSLHMFQGSPKLRRHPAQRLGASDVGIFTPLS